VPNDTATDTSRQKPAALPLADNLKNGRNEQQANNHAAWTPPLFAKPPL